MSERRFSIAFIFSLGLHTMLLLPMPGLMHAPQRPPETKIEITYIDIQEAERLDQEILSQENVEVTLKREDAAPAPAMPLPEPQEEPLKEEAVEKVEALSQRRTISPVSLSMRNGAQYSLNYTRALREKIDAYIQAHYKGSMGRGEARLSFVLHSDGSVQSVSIIRDNLYNNRRLRALAIDSIYKSSPFKPFPPELNFPEFVFFIEISFNTPS